MRLSTRSQFAISAMTDLALRHEQGPVSLATISVRQGVSLSYLEDLFAKLKRAGLVESARGPGGGYYLGRPAQSISVADISRAVEKSPSGPARGGKRGDNDWTSDLWLAYETKLTEYLESIHLQSLVAQYLAKNPEASVQRRPQPTVVRAPSRPVPATGLVNSVFALGSVALGKA